MLLMLQVAALTKSLSVVHLLCRVASSCDEGFDIHLRVVAQKPCKAYE